MPTTPWSHPGMTVPVPRVNANGWFRLHEESKIFFDE
jgi:hypothetical protein